ncbi:hypothetical protein Pflav_089190 [Phytohabitans flavus]|uniref:Tox-PL domain-containing protein n=1 Tax=Phytohabitans flavus TaxID=1076124 RepID=A0A6F8Y901_9ACTN|nr:toxin glutamine deamidase domain-containing protein [Phytohabitans flavus]BCB82509.1 hypothetical protein Pflav_089190 [Phytohabitans flavus]
MGPGGQLGPLTDPGALAPGVPSLDTTRTTGPDHLGPIEDPQFQADIEQSLDTGSGYQTGADPSTHPYGRLVNDGGPNMPGRNNNCLDSSLAALSSFYGDPRVSAPRWPDVLPDGTPDTTSGEADGVDRAENWLGGTWDGPSSPMPGDPAGRAAAVAGQYADLHAQIAAAGPGASALVIADWLDFDSATGQVSTDANGDVVPSTSSHAFVIVYPHGASGPVWWDPQHGQTWTSPPTHYMADTHTLWSMRGDSLGAPPAPAAPSTTSTPPAPAARPTTNIEGTPYDTAGTPDHGGRSPDADQSADRGGPGGDPAPVRERLAGEGGPDGRGTQPGDATGSGELHHRPERDGDGPVQPVDQDPDGAVQRGEAGGPADRSADLAGADDAPAVADGQAPQGGPAPHATDQAYLDALDPADAGALQTALDAAGPVARQMRADLTEVADALRRDFGTTDVEVIGNGENDVKGLVSLARKYVIEGDVAGILVEGDTAPVDAFLRQANDLARFSLRAPEGPEYDAVVTAALERLQAEPYNYRYDPADDKSFWRPGNRFYGRNVTLRNPDGHAIELQFPTQASWDAGKLTHDAYERVRLDRPDPVTQESLPPHERVRAFLEILKVNRDADLAHRIPGGMDPALGKDTSFAKWIAARSEVWTRYEGWLADHGLTFADDVRAHGLGVEDFPVAPRWCRKARSMTASFKYFALYRREDRTDPPVGLLAEGSLAPDRRLVTVGWSHRHRTWTEASASLNWISTSLDWTDRFETVDRATAERIARESLGVELPSEEEMQRIGEGPSVTFQRPTQQP